MKNYRGNSNIGKSNYKLRCDFVCESEKTIIEYDERQHFTKARQISLENYPEDTVLSFNKDSWINSCEVICARDNHPHNRDEVRAFYDSVRDIEASKNGYRLLLNFYEDTSHTNPTCIVSKNDFINQSKQMISAIGANHQSNVASIYIMALN